MEDHSHDWVPHLSDAEGVYSKRDLDNDVSEFRCRGRVLRCADGRCPAFLFIPHNREFMAVEAVAA